MVAKQGVVGVGVREKKRSLPRVQNVFNLYFRVPLDLVTAAGSRRLKSLHQKMAWVTHMLQFLRKQPKAANLRNKKSWLTQPNS
jgi:hypothetical protein